MEKRAACRKYYKEIRNNMSPEEVNEKSKKICNLVLGSKVYKQADVIFAYYPLTNEVNSLPVIKQALKEGKKVALPKTTEKGQMEFFEIKKLSDVEEGRFHIMEPKKACRKLEPSDCLKTLKNILVLVPGVVFDKKGNRYGYGGGYYDRYFERYPDMTRIALAYKLQISEKTLECLPTDVKMHVIITEDEIVEIKVAD